MVLYDPGDWTIKGTFSMGLTNNVKGITHCGGYFWAIDTEFLYQCKIFGGTFEILRSIDMTGISSDFMELSAIANNGHSLFISHWEEFTSGGAPPVVTQTGRVAAYNRDGVHLKTFSGLNAATATYVDNQYYDIAYTGVYICATYVDSSRAVVRWLLPESDQIVRTVIAATTVQAKRGYTFAGNGFYGVIDNAPRTIVGVNDAEVIYKVGTGVGAVDVQGMCYSAMRIPGHYQRVGAKMTGGEFVAIVYN